MRIQTWVLQERGSPSCIISRKWKVECVGELKRTLEMRERIISTSRTSAVKTVKHTERKELQNQKEMSVRERQRERERERELF